MPGVIITLKKQRQDGKTRYRARWTTPYPDAQPETLARPVYKVHSDKKWLQEWLRQMDQRARDEALNPQPPAPPAPPVSQTMTFQQLVDEWRATHLPTLQPRTITRYEGMLRNYLLPQWANLTLATIDRATVKRYFAALRQTPCTAKHPPDSHYPPEHTHSAAQIGKLQTLVSSIFTKEGIDSGYTDTNPASGIRLPTPPEHEMLSLTAEELHAVAEQIDPRYRVAIYLAGYRGPRASELWALRRQDLDLQSRRVHIRRALKRTYGQDQPLNAPLFGLPKNGKARSFRLPRFLAEMLAAHLTTVPLAPSALVFTAPEGGIVRHELFVRRFWTPAITRCITARKLPAEKAALRFHDLRHTAASIMGANGYSLEQIREVLGHKDTRTTARYHHFVAGHDDPLLDQLDAAFEATQRSHRHLREVSSEAAA